MAHQDSNVQRAGPHRSFENVSRSKGTWSRVESTTYSLRPRSTPSHTQWRHEKSWRAPATILISLLLGLATALAHHTVNVSLNGKEVISAGVSQAWVSRIATGLAFLVKTSFVVTASVAFVQRQWLSCRYTPFRIEEIDALTSILSSLWSFLVGPALWFRNSLLTLVAVITWILPLAAVVTPGALSVEPRSTSNTTSAQVPQLSLDPAGYVSGYRAVNLGLSTHNLIYRIAQTTAMSAQPLALLSDYQNETYHLTFHAPAIRCGMANSSVTQAVEDMYRNFSSQTGDSIRFLSWFDNDPSIRRLFDGDGTDMDPSGQTFATLDLASADTPHMFISTNLGSTELTNGLVNVTECLLYNATYDVDFDFHYPRQTINITTPQYLNKVPLQYAQTASVAPKSSTLLESYCYGAIMQSFGRLLVGSSVQRTGFRDSWFTVSELLAINWNETEATQSGLEQLFQNITISMLSDKSLTKNATAASKISINVTRFPIVYVYKPRDLIVAYGASFLCALVCACVGLHAFHVNDGSYQNNFSSFLRVTTDQELHALIGDHDDGSDPLPDYLARVQVMINGSEEA